MDRHLTVGLLWHSLGSGNLGVGALTESNVTIIARALERIGYDARFLVFGTASTPTTSKLPIEGVHSVEIRPLHLLRKSFGEEVQRCDLVFDIGEGDSFSDIYGFKRFFYMWLSKQRVIWARKPLVLSPQTIGPFDGLAVKWLARSTMKRATSIFARDKASMSLLRELGLERHSTEVIDVAFALPYDTPNRQQSGVTRVGINVSALLYHGGYDRANQFGLKVDYRQFVESTIDELVGRDDVEVHLIPHVVPRGIPIEDDYAVTQELERKFRTVKIAPRFSIPSEAKTYIASMDFFTGARMHACIAAFSANVPVVPFAYSRKFTGLFDTLQYEHVIDGRTVDTDRAVRKVLEGLSNRRELGEAVLNGNAIAAVRIAQYEDALVAIVTELAHVQKRH